MAGYDGFIRAIANSSIDEFLIEIGLIVKHNGQYLYNIEPNGKLNYILQNVRNIEIIAQMEKITKLFQVNSIPHFFFKGPILSVDLYEEHEMRRCSDIDLFVPSDYLSVALDSIGKVGFFHDEQPVSSKRYADYKAILGAHLNHFYDLETKVPLELHLSPIYCGRTDAEYEINKKTREYLYRDVRFITINNIHYPTFSVTVTLFSLMEHFVRHIACDVVYSIMDINNSLHIPLKTLFDCCRLIKKYNNEIEWNELKELSSVFERSITLEIAYKSIIAFDSDMKYLMPKLHFSANTEASSSYTRVLKRLSQIDLKKLYQNRHNQVFIRNLYWCTESPSRPVDEYINTKQVYHIDDSDACRFDRISDALSFIVQKRQHSPVACLQCYIEKNSFCFDYDYLLPHWTKRDSKITLHFFLFDASAITENAYINSGIINIYLDSAMQVISLVVEEDKETNIHLITPSAERRNETLHIHTSIPFTIVPYFTRNLKTIYYDFHMFHHEGNMRCIRQLFLWNYTEECDLAKMNRIDVR